MQSVSFSMLHCFEGDHMLADYHIHTEFCTYRHMQPVFHAL